MVSSRGIFMPKKVRAQFAGLPSSTRDALELHLENLGHFLATDGVNALRSGFAQTPDGQRFVTNVDGVQLTFTVDEHSRVVFLHELSIGRNE